MRKIFLAVFLPVAILLGGIVGLTYHTETKSKLAITEAKESGYLNLQVKTTTNTFHHIISDLMFLAEQQRELQKKLNLGDYSEHGLAQDYLMFAIRKGIYDQIRFLDEKGMEIVRVNYNKGKPVVVPVKKLQNKGTRYYFKDAMQLGEGEIYVSPFDLNIENKKIEIPLKPVIRIATPVFDSSGERRGIVIVNFFGEKLLNSFRDIAANAEGDPMFLNRDGYWLLGPAPEDEWGFMYEERKERSFRNNFPEEWKAISGRDSGQFTTANGLYTFVNIYPLEEVRKVSIIKTFIKAGKGLDARNYYWTIVSHVPSDRLYLDSLDLRKKLLELYAVLLLITGIGAWLIASAKLSSRETERELRESEERFRKLADATEEGVAIQRNHIIVDANQRFASMFGYDRSEVIGMDMIEFCEPQSREVVEEKVDTGDEAPFEMMSIKKDGSSFISEVCVKSISYHGQAASVEAARDITKFKETEYMLKTRNREIEDLNVTLEKRVKEEVVKSREKDYMLIQQSRLAAMGEMIGHIAHQWRQPLSLLGLLLVNIKDDFKYDELDKANLDGYTSKAEKLIDKMSATIDDFRNFFNPNKEKEEFSPAKAIEDTFRLVEGSFKYENINVTIEEETDVTVLGYPNEYSQVVLNLVNNAKDAIKEKGVKDGSIMINVGRDNGNCVVTVTDNGGGIPEEIIEKIFDPYFSSKKKGAGTGLGLYMSKMIIEDNMDGRIEVRNVKGGARFRVLLPVASESNPS